MTNDWVYDIGSLVRERWSLFLKVAFCEARALVMLRASPSCNVDDACIEYLNVLQVLRLLRWDLSVNVECVAAFFLLRLDGDGSFF